MPAIALADGNSTVFSNAGQGRRCRFPMPTTTGDATVTSIYIGGSNHPVVFGDQVGNHPSSGDCAIPDPSTLSSGSGTVFMGGRRVGRIGDQYAAGIELNVITSGFETVFVGG